MEHYELMRPAEAARLLGVSPLTLTNWAKAGKVRAYMLPSGHRRYSRTEIEALYQQPHTKEEDNS